MDPVDAFVHDQDPNAYARLVDRLMSTSAYGERWAGMWLDLARYADSKGYASDPLRTIWRYRDWVIQAFNENMPYDQFTREQLAGDLLPDADLDQLLATAFHRNTMNNTEGGTDNEEFRVIAIKDRVSTTMQVWMGLTMGCAECHSHKYDPITQREYYRFYSIFNQTADVDTNDDAPTLPAPTTLMQAQLRDINRQIKGLQQTLNTPTPELAAAQAKWEKGYQASSEWTAINPVEARSLQGADLTVLDDGSVKASGKAPDNDTYVVKGAVEGGGWTAFRLEALPDESFGGASGRKGNFVLSRFGVSVGDTGDLVSGRYVRIELPGKGKMLSLAEVQAFSNGENIATKGKATQSSTNYDGPAELAIDGNTDGDYFAAKSTTHTDNSDNPWWEVDLGAHKPIDELRVWNRTDGNVGSRLSNWKISLLNQQREVVWSREVKESPNPSARFTLSGPQPVEFARASATFEQNGFTAKEAIDPPKPKEDGWALHPNFKQPQSAVFIAKSPVGKGTLNFKLEQLYKSPGLTLGRFRLSATSDPVLIRRETLPGDVLAIIDTPADQRTEAQAGRIAEYYRTLAPLLKPVRDQIAKLEKSKPDFPLIPILKELPKENHRKTQMMLRGNFLSLGDEVKPGAPAAFSGFLGEVPQTRLDVADWLVHPDNPLTARVAVNRFWAQLFGRGLVVTEEDFGTQGEPPTHPELLDWMATEFVRLNWDVKAFLKTVVMSASYRQSAESTPEKLEKDFFNQLLSRGPRFRLDAEQVRDQALALSGLLTRKVGGPSVYPPQPEGLWRAAFNGRDRKWPTDTGEDRYRRGLYTFWRRTVPYPSMATFDAPSREVCNLRRIRTNTPLQAFVTMNDPVYVEASQALARRIYGEGGESSESRVNYALKLCLCREPAPEQVAAVMELLTGELKHYQDGGAEAVAMATEPLGALPEGMPVPELAAWTVVANTLLNLDPVLSK